MFNEKSLRFFLYARYPAAEPVLGCFFDSGREMGYSHGLKKVEIGWFGLFG
jgi:hypothetical protein